jgi:hypothetical protein
MAQQKKFNMPKQWTCPECDRLCFSPAFLQKHLLFHGYDNDAAYEFAGAIMQEAYEDAKAAFDAEREMEIAGMGAAAAGLMMF